MITQMGENKSDRKPKKSVGEILRSSMPDIETYDSAVYQLIITKADEGFFEQHQTTGSLKNLAIQLLNMPQESSPHNEN